MSWQSIADDGSISYPLGENAVGQLVYAELSDRVSAQLVRTNQVRFASDEWQVAHAEGIATAWPNYFGYFGTFTIDPDAGAVTHHVEAGWFPNLVGTEQVR